MARLLEAAVLDVPAIARSFLRADYAAEDGTVGHNVSPPRRPFRVGVKEGLAAIVVLVSASAWKVRGNAVDGHDGVGVEKGPPASMVEWCHEGIA